MATTLTTVRNLLETHVVTGLEGGAHYDAFVNACASDYGAIEGAGVGQFKSVKLSGKGDKAKGKINRGTVEFKGGHSVAMIVLAGASAIKDLENSINCLVGKLDARELCAGWLERRLTKLANKPAPEPEPAQEAEVENEENKIPQEA